MFFSYDSLVMRYQPFPIGLAKPLMSESVYQEFVDNFPPIELFASFEQMGKRGRKYTLSEKENPRAYRQFVQANGHWREFHKWIKSDAFVYGLLDALRERDIDLGYRSVPIVKRVVKRVKDGWRGRPVARHVPLKARFEFSALPAAGGHLVPHTDAPTKIATMVLSIIREGEWDPAFGGGTDINQPKDSRYGFNYVNRLADFEDMEVVDTYEFTPNQAVVFVKTFNSWHSVRPMTGAGSDALRRTLTINIEALS
jgi:hypothetical protein